MATLTELYAKVRTQTDTLTTELPDALINQYLHEAFDRTIAAENRWPFYEQTWELVMPAGETYITLPGDVNKPAILGLWDLDGGFRLVQIRNEQALDHMWYLNYSGVNGSWVYTLWGNEIRLFPSRTYDEDRNYHLLGWRRPAPWSSIGPNSGPDCDERLHLPLAHYATALAYAREEDETLEAVYMQRWQRDVEMARQAIMEPAHHRPLVMGSAPNFGIGN